MKTKMKSLSGVNYNSDNAYFIEEKEVSIDAFEKRKKKLKIEKHFFLAAPFKKGVEEHFNAVDRATKEEYLYIIIVSSNKDRAFKTYQIIKK